MSGEISPQPKWQECLKVVRGSVADVGEDSQRHAVRSLDCGPRPIPVSSPWRLQSRESVERIRCTNGDVVAQLRLSFRESANNTWNAAIRPGAIGIRRDVENAQ